MAGQLVPAGRRACRDTRGFSGSGMTFLAASIFQSVSAMQLCSSLSLAAVTYFEIVASEQLLTGTT